MTEKAFLKYSGRIVLVKVGGELFASDQIMRDFARDIKALRDSGIKVVVVHGGGPQISEHLTRIGKKPIFKNGLRATDDETMEVTAMVLLGKINAPFVSFLSTLGCSAIGLHGGVCGLVRVVQENIELGLVGRIVSVNIAPILTLIEEGIVPVIAPLGSDEKGALYNINADLVAGAIAGSLKAATAIFISNVRGVYRTFGDESSLIAQLSLQEANTLMEQGSISAGMIPKIEGMLAAVKAGTHRTKLIDGRVPHALLLNGFIDSDGGTLIGEQ